MATIGNMKKSEVTKWDEIPWRDVHASVAKKQHNIAVAYKLQESAKVKQEA